MFQTATGGGGGAAAIRARWKRAATGGKVFLGNLFILLILILTKVQFSCILWGGNKALGGNADAGGGQRALSVDAWRRVCPQSDDCGYFGLALSHLGFGIVSLAGKPGGTNPKRGSGCGGPRPRLRFGLVLVGDSDSGTHEVVRGESLAYQEIA